MDILEYLQSAGKFGKSHSFDFIIALLDIDTETKAMEPHADDSDLIVVIGNKDIFKWVKNHGGTISSITLQRRKNEIIDMGLAVRYHRKIGSGDDIILTPKGIRVAKIIKKFAEDVAVAAADQKEPQSPTTETAPEQPSEAPSPEQSIEPQPTESPAPATETQPSPEAPQEMESAPAETPVPTPPPNP